MIVVTGAAGFIGSHLVDRLLRDGVEVVGVDVFDDFYDPAIKRRNLAGASAHPGFTLVEGDIRDPGMWDRMPAGVDAVVHLAARAGVRPSIENPELYADVNLGGTARVLAYLARRSVPRLVFASSSSVYGERGSGAFAEDDPVDHPISPYAATKRSGELMCHAAHHIEGTSTVCLRFFTAFGPRQRPDLAIHKFARLMARGRPVPMYGDGSSERDYTYVADVVDGVVKALDVTARRPDAFEIVNLGGGAAVRLDRMIRLLGEALGVEPVVERLPAQPGDVSRTLADPRRAREVLGFEAATDFESGLTSFVRWFREEGAP